jgi:DmsE family decaheme c-type cytochrome
MSDWRIKMMIVFAALVVCVMAVGAFVDGTLAQSARNLPEAKYTGKGPEGCLSCHGGAKMTIIAETPHGNPDDPHAPYALESCESCHGPGSFHVSRARGGVGFPPLNNFRFVGFPSENQFQTCLSCHAKTSGDRLGIGWTGSKHDEAGLGCTSCHKVHSTNASLANVLQEQNLCAGCHGMTNSKHDGFEKNGIRMRDLRCSTCHDPHDK